MEIVLLDITVQYIKENRIKTRNNYVLKPRGYVDVGYQEADRYRIVLTSDYLLVCLYYIRLLICVYPMETKPETVLVTDPTGNVGTEVIRRLMLSKSIFLDI
jgi:hypothetical protein